jgi:hypothetical protein
LSGLTEDELNVIKTRADRVLDCTSDYEAITVQLAVDIRMLLLDKKLKET